MDEMSGISVMLDASNYFQGLTQSQNYTDYPWIYGAPVSVGGLVRCEGVPQC